MRWLDGITDYGHEFEQALGVCDAQAKQNMSSSGK